jgi:hypothetical protein
MLPEQSNGRSLTIHVFQPKSSDEFTVVLKKVDPTRTHDFAFPHGAGEHKLIADTRNCGPFAGADFGHRFACARIDKLDHDHECLFRRLNW